VDEGENMVGVVVTPRSRGRQDVVKVSA
jgi:hypothetical protein